MHVCVFVRDVLVYSSLCCFGGGDDGLCFRIAYKRTGDRLRGDRVRHQGRESGQGRHRSLQGEEESKARRLQPRMPQEYYLGGCSCVFFATRKYVTYICMHVFVVYVYV